MQIRMEQMGKVWTCAMYGLLIVLLGLADVNAQSIHKLGSATIKDFSCEESGSRAQMFDVSPDGSKLAAQLLVVGSDKNISITVATWDISKKAVIGKADVLGPVGYSHQFPNPQYVSNLRFTPDGTRLVSLVGRDLNVIDVQTLAVSHLLSVPEGTTLRRLALSGDSHILAVSSSAATSPWEPATVHLFDVGTRKQIAEWKSAYSPQDISLSPDGSQMLLSNFAKGGPPEGDVALVESLSGTLIRTFDIKNAGGHGSPYGAGGARYLGKNKFLSLPNQSADKPEDLARSTIKIWDIKTGELLHEFTYGKYGIRGPVVARDSSPIIAAITNSGEPADVGRDSERVGFRKMLLFKLNAREPFYVSDDLRAFHSRAIFPDGEIKLSDDGQIIAVSTNDHIEIYQLKM
jgi:WD40 repeat protein